MKTQAQIILSWMENQKNINDMVFKRLEMLERGNKR